MSSLYQFKVLKLEENKIQIAAEVIHPDSNYLNASPGFALMLLYDKVKNDSPIKKEVDFDDTLDESWMQKNARAFIQSVDLELGKSTKKGWKTGVMDITVTHPAWLEHMKGVKSWDSASFDPARTYDVCEPRFPDKDDAPVSAIDATSREGFMPVWKFMIPEYLLNNQKDILWFPAFGEKHYKASEIKITDLSDDNLRKLEGTLVMTPESFGILSRRDNDWGMIKCGRGSMGSRHIGGEMTQMVLNPKKKNIYPDSPESLLVWSRPVVYETKITGDTITFKVMIMHKEEDRVSLKTKMSALEFLLKPFEYFFGDEYRGEGPLCETMNAILKEKNISSTSTAYIHHKEIADQFIVSSNVAKTRDVPFPKLYDLSNEEIIGLYTFDKWPAYEISVKVTDAKWLEQYPQIPFSHIFERYD